MILLLVHKLGLVEQPRGALFLHSRNKVGMYVHGPGFQVVT